MPHIRLKALRLTLMTALCIITIIFGNTVSVTIILITSALILYLYVLYQPFYRLAIVRMRLCA